MKHRPFFERRRRHFRIFLPIVCSFVACERGPSTEALRVDTDLIASNLRSLWTQKELPTFLFVNSKEGKQLPALLGDLTFASGAKLRYLYSREWQSQNNEREERHMRVHYELVHPSTGARIRATMSDGKVFVEELTDP